MSLIEFLKEFGEATEDIKEEREKAKKAMDIAKFNSKKRR